MAHPTNWNLCFLCQSEDKDGLLTPDEGYGYITGNIKEFIECGRVPMGVNINRLDEGNGVPQTLKTNCAKYHKACYLQFTTSRLNRAKKRAAARQNLFETTPSPKKTRSVIDTSPEDSTSEQESPCFFCESAVGKLHSVAVGNKVDEHVRYCATRLGDTKLLAKLATCDMFTLKARYHENCLVDLYNRERSLTTSETSSETPLPAQQVATAQLVSYIIEDSRSKSEPVYKLSDLVKIHQNIVSRIQDEPPTTHATRLKEALLKSIPGLIATTSGRDILLGFESDISGDLDQKYRNEGDTDAITLIKAADIVRRKVLKAQELFNGTFSKEHVLSSVPSELEILIRAILEGSSITFEPTYSRRPIVNTIGQMIMFNAIKNTKSRPANRSCTGTPRRNAERETPAALYHSFKIYGKTRQKELIDTQSKMGIGISYDRLLKLSSSLANAVINRYKAEGKVCPLNLRHNVFTTGALDNLDHDPTSTTANISFHGTAISMLNHPTTDCPGDERPPLNLAGAHEGGDDNSVISHLPAEYTHVPEVHIKDKSPFVPAVSADLSKQSVEESKPYKSFLEGENDWLTHASKLLEKDDLEHGDMISWAGFHASKADGKAIRPKAQVGLLPLFKESAHTPSMVKHGMEIVKANTGFLNPGQTPVITMDQPLFAIGKQIQWEHPDLGEDRYIIMLGALHIEMMMVKLIGDFLEGSGWSDAITEAGIFTAGRSDALITGSSVTRSRYAHQVTLVVLTRLQEQAYRNMQIIDSSSDTDVKDWSKGMAKLHPSVKFWDTVIELERILCQFAKSLRTGDFHLYVSAIQRILPWAFSLDHVNYARWLSIHLRDMIALEKSHPAVYKEFLQGKFVAQRSDKAFSLMALDQVHEQVNKVIKGDGGAVGLFESEHALRRWLTSGPEIARLIAEYESIWETAENSNDMHHEQSFHRQKAFANDVKRLEAVLKECGNPFMDNSPELMNVHDRTIVDAESVREVLSKGMEQFETFWAERISSRTEPITKPIKRNNIRIFKGNLKKPKSKIQTQIDRLKKRCRMFSQLYIGSHSAQKDGNLETFFQHEHTAEPPSLTDDGKMRIGKKSDLLPCLESLQTNVPNKHPEVSMKIIDGAAMVNMLKPKATTQDFSDYSREVVMPHILGELRFVQRLDVIWDQYPAESLKDQVHEQRGCGARRRVLASTKVPKDWGKFLRNSENKEELFRFLAEDITSADIPGKHVLVTKGEQVLTSQETELDTTGIDPCNHEEADTRMMLHAAHAADNGHKKILLRTVDTDVLVLSIAMFPRLQIDELWVGFGTGAKFRFIAAHEISKRLGEAKASALPYFHALTGCDVTSSFYGHGKKSAWDVWMESSDSVTSVFSSLADHPENDLSDDTKGAIEQFVIRLYSKTVKANSVNEARQLLLSTCNRSIDNVPPTQGALLQHILRASYQAGYVWSESLNKQQELPSPQDWGWCKVGTKWVPFWTELPEVQTVCRELKRCTCKTRCKNKCGCKKRQGGVCSAACRCPCKQETLSL